MTFPSPGDEIYKNEDGEVTGWSKPAEPDYCDIHGITFTGVICPECDHEEFGDADDWDPGPEVDDEGGMSEVSLFAPDGEEPPF
jgi:hypothetical protein